MVGKQGIVNGQTELSEVNFFLVAFTIYLYSRRSQILLQKSIFQ